MTTTFSVEKNCRTIHFITAYAPQTRCTDCENDKFHREPRRRTTEVDGDVVLACDLNGHIGKEKKVSRWLGLWNPKSWRETHPGLSKSQKSRDAE